MLIKKNTSVICIYKNNITRNERGFKEKDHFYHIIFNFLSHNRQDLKYHQNKLFIIINTYLLKFYS